MFKKLKETNRGFTIIEVMIVLAIAALILLIVLLAVPALQRNARNTAIKNDASAIVGAISTYESDNDGKAVIVANVNQETDDTSKVDIGGDGDAIAKASIQAGTVVTPQADAPTGTIEPGKIFVVPGMDCKETASTRAVAVWYSIETSSDPVNKCIDS
jgi:prepilin-type N-terminal cleavage/methylation domain-containing protein